MTDLVPIQGTIETFGERSHLEVWADSARQAAQIAVSLAKTPFVPQSLRDRDAGVTAANITAAILTGAELNLEPMASLRAIDVIQGTPAMRAIALRALVQSKGHDIWVVESTTQRAIVAGQRHGSDREQKSTWTMDRAKALGLTGKDNWRKQPEAMLVARATSELCRLIAADVILGIPYSVEELEDGDHTAPADSATVAPKRTARRQLRPVADHPEPPLEEPVIDELAAEAAEIEQELAASKEPTGLFADDEPPLEDA